MAVNRDKLMDSAQKHVRKGSWDRAIKDYQQILEAEPDDVRTRLKVADLLVKVNRYEEALTEYLQVAYHYASDDIYDKAVAVYKQALRIAPNDPRLHRDLGEAYYRYGRLKDALRAFHQAQKIFRENNDAIAQRDVLERMVAIDPEDIGLQIQIAERYEKDGERANSLMYFRRAAEHLLEEGRLDEYAQVAERIVFLEPADYRLRKHVVRLYLDRENNKHALKHLQILFKDMPNDVETLDMLGLAFGRLGQNDKAVLVYLEAAKAQRRQGQEQLAHETFRKILKLDPNHPEALQVVGRPKQDSSPQLADTGNLGQNAPATQDALEGVEFLDDDEWEDNTIQGETFQEEDTKKGVDFFEFAAHELGDTGSDILHRIDDRPGTGIGQRRTEAVSDIADVQDLVEVHIEATEDIGGNDVRQIITESEVFLKYRLFDRADEVLTKAVRMAPDSVGVREQLHRLRAMQGEMEAAANELFQLARITRTTPSRAADYLRRAREFVSEAVVHQHATQLGIALTGEQPVRVEELSPDFIDEVSEGIEEVSEGFEYMPAGDTSVEFLSPDDDDEIDTDETLSGNSAVEDSEEVIYTLDDLDAEDILEEMDDIADELSIENADEFDIGDVDAMDFDEAQLGAIESSEVDDPFEFALSGEDADAMFDQLFSEATAVASKAVPKKVATKGMGDLRDVDLLLDQGMVSEAEDALEKFSENSPNHPGAPARLARIRELKSANSNPFGAKSLSGKFNPDYSQLSVARLGALEPESMNTSLELGISYLDMGMWDDAIEEFRQALDDPQAAPAAMLHMATCELRRGNAAASENLLKMLLTRTDVPHEIENKANEALAAIARQV